MPDACRCESHGPLYPVETEEPARITGVFTDLITGEAVDPDAVRFLYKQRGDTESTTLLFGEDDELVRKEAGVFYVDVPTDQPGPLYYRFESDGPVGISEGQVTVRASAVE